MVDATAIIVFICGILVISSVSYVLWMESNFDKRAKSFCELNYGIYQLGNDLCYLPEGEEYIPKKIILSNDKLYMGNYNG
jgi:hypothetical protein